MLLRTQQVSQKLYLLEQDAECSHRRKRSHGGMGLSRALLQIYLPQLKARQKCYDWYHVKLGWKAILCYTWTENYSTLYLDGEL